MHRYFLGGLCLFAYFLISLRQVILLFLLIGIGYLLGRLGKLTEKGVSQMSFLLLYVVIPCVIINALQADLSREQITRFLTGFVVFFLAHLAYLFCTLFLFPKRPPSQRPTLQMASMYGNVGFMGLPLITAIYGPDMTYLVLPAIITFNLFNWTHAITIMGGKMSWKRTLLNPGIIAVVFSLICLLCSIRLPSVVRSTVSSLAAVNTPLAMLVIGAQMSLVDLRSTFFQTELYAVSLLRLVLFPAATALALLPFHLDSTLYCICVVLCATPTAGTTSILAQQFDRSAGLAAQAVSLTTLLSVITLPIFSVLAQWLA